jgi:predicted transposase YbfD/YdcC
VLLHDVRYFICSLNPDEVTAADLLRHCREHWRIENCLHFLKDRWWDEDRHHTRRPGLSALMAAINNAAISIHRLFEKENLPLRAAADHIAWKPAIGLELLN